MDVQHADDGWKQRHGSRFHLDMIVNDMKLKDVVTIADGDSIQRDVQNRHEASLDDVDPLFMSGDKEMLKVTSLAKNLQRKW